MREEKRILISRHKLLGAFIALLCVTVTLLEIRGNTATSPEPGYEPLVPGSDATHIFTGTVLSIESRWVSEREYREINHLNESRPVNESAIEFTIYSWAKIEVDQYIKGEGPKVVTVRYAGGIVGDTVIIYEHFPGGVVWLEVGERVKVWGKLVNPDENLFSTWNVEHFSKKIGFSPPPR